MRVAHVTPVFPPYRGGMGTVAFEQARHLAAAGARVSVLTPRGRRAPLVPPGVEVIPLTPWITFGNAALLPQAALRSRRFEVVHLHYPFFGAAELLCAGRALGGPPLLLQYQMDVIGEGWPARVFRWHRRLLLPWILRRADAIVVTSRDYAESSYLAPHLAALGPRVVTLPAGVDLERFRVGGPRRSASSFALAARSIVLFVGGLDRAHYFKGLHVLLAAICHLPDVGLVIAGSGELQPSYVAEVARLGITGRVHFAGDVADEELPVLYRSADVVVLPSIDRTEAFGLVLLEAMACGTPVVASDLHGVRTLVEDGRNGYLAAPGNALQLADCIRRAVAQRDTLGHHARQQVETNYAWPTLTARLLDLYRELLGAGRPRRRAG